MKQENIFVKLNQYVTNSLQESGQEYPRCVINDMIRVNGFLDRDGRDFLKRDIYINFINVAYATEAEICAGGQVFNPARGKWEDVEPMSNECYVIYFSNNSQPICVTKASLDGVMETTHTLE